MDADQCLKLRTTFDVTFTVRPSPYVPSLLLPRPTRFLDSTFPSPALKYFFMAQVKYRVIINYRRISLRPFTRPDSV